jgi:hypothetical protein
MLNGDFTALSKQFETLMGKLKQSRDPKARKRLLAEIKDVIAKIDNQIAKDQLLITSKSR